MSKRILFTRSKQKEFFDLVIEKTNSPSLRGLLQFGINIFIKVFVVLVYTISALFIFIIEGKIHWGYGLTLAVGNSSGSWIASRLSVKKGDNWVRWFIIITVIALAVKLFKLRRIQNP